MSRQIISMMQQRFIELVNHTTDEKSKHRDFEELTGIKRTTVKHLMNGKQRFNEEHLKAVADAFPQYKMWFAFGEVLPEAGQISPELDQTAGDYQGTGTDT